MAKIGPARKSQKIRGGFFVLSKVSLRNLFSKLQRGYDDVED